MIGANGETLGSLYRSIDAGLHWKRVRPAGTAAGASSISSRSRPTGARSRSCASVTARRPRSTRWTAARTGRRRRSLKLGTKSPAVYASPLAASGTDVPARHEPARLLAPRARGASLGGAVAGAVQCGLAARQPPAGLRRYAALLGAPRRGVGRQRRTAGAADRRHGAARDAAADSRRGPLVRRRRRRLAASSLACAIAWPLWGGSRTGSARRACCCRSASSIRRRSAASRCSPCSDAPVVALAACAALAGATLPPIGACMRALWPSCCPVSELRDTAYALEAWLQELFFIIGPVTRRRCSPRSGRPGRRCSWPPRLSASARSGSRSPRRARRRAHAARASRAGALGSAAVRTIIVASLRARRRVRHRRGLHARPSPRSTARGHRADSRSRASALGSLIGGIWIGTRPPARRLELRFAFSLALLALALVPPLAAPSLPVMCVLMLIAGTADRPGLRGLLRPGRRARAARHDDRGVRLARARPSWPASPSGRRSAASRSEQFGLPGALALAAPCAGIAALLTFARRASLAIPDPLRDADAEGSPVSSSPAPAARSAARSPSLLARAGRAADPVRARRRARARPAGRRGGRGRLPRPATRCAPRCGPAIASSWSACTRRSRRASPRTARSSPLPPRWASASWPTSRSSSPRRRRPSTTGTRTTRPSR